MPKNDFLWPMAKRFMKERSLFEKLDPISLGVLEWVAAQGTDEGPIFIQDIVMRSGVASPATIYKAISALLGVHMISVIVDPSDTRRRIVKPTAKAIAAFEEQDRIFKAWLKAEGLSNRR